MSALPGVALEHMAQVPTAVPIRPGSYYFLIESKGGLYENMIKARTITIFGPAIADVLKLELFAIEA